MIVRSAPFVGRVAACALLMGILPAASADSPVPADRYGLDPATGIVIAPRFIPVALSRAAAQPEAENDEAAREGDGPIINPLPKRAAAADDASKYREVFESIPFSRAEFDANPSYRNDATLELITGNPRPQKIQINMPAPQPPVDFYPTLLNVPTMWHYFDMTRGPYSRYQHLFGYEGGYRPQFYRY